MKTTYEQSNTRKIYNVTVHVFRQVYIHIYIYIYTCIYIYIYIHIYPETLIYDAVCIFFILQSDNKTWT